MHLQIVSFDVGTKNFAYCISEVGPASSEFHVKYLDVVSLGCKKGNMQQAVDAVIELLDTLVYQQLDLSLPIVVLIESQMTAAMKCIQTAINTYFKVTARYASLDIDSKYLSARHKLSLIQHYPEFTTSRTPEVAATAYRQNKVDSVALATWVLTHAEPDSSILEKIQRMKKKDDATDAYLMTLYYAKVVIGA